MARPLQLAKARCLQLACAPHFQLGRHCCLQLAALQDLPWLAKESAAVSSQRCYLLELTSVSEQRGRRLNGQERLLSQPLFSLWEQLVLTSWITTGPVSKALPKSLLQGSCLCLVSLVWPWLLVPFPLKRKDTHHHRRRHQTLELFPGVQTLLMNISVGLLC